MLWLSELTVHGGQIGAAVLALDKKTAVRPIT